MIASRLQFLGIQDAARKRRIDQGPWAGAIYICNEKCIQKTVTTEKWNKARAYIIDITEPRLVLSQKIVAKKEGCGPPEGSSIMPVPGSS